MGKTIKYFLRIEHVSDINFRFTSNLADLSQAATEDSSSVAEVALVATGGVSLRVRRRLAWHCVPDQSTDHRGSNDDTNAPTLSPTDLPTIRPTTTPMTTPTVTPTYSPTAAPTADMSGKIAAGY